MITVIQAPAYLTVQDAGRVGQRAVGVPPSGAMDLDAAAALNIMLGNAPSAALLEWAIAGGVLRFDVAATIALGGAGVDCAHERDGMRSSCAPWTPILIRPGDTIVVTRFVRGRFFYLAVAGGIDVPLVAGSRSTNLPARFGGFEGRRLARGDVLRIGGGEGARRARDAAGVQSVAPFDASYPPDPTTRMIRVLRGPQADRFDDATWSTFLSATYTVSPASDRMGYRLTGPTLPSRTDVAFPSEPTCVGAIQAPPGGAPIVLLRDGPTVGGYPKIAAIRSEDIGLFAQRLPGEPVRFALD